MQRSGHTTRAVQPLLRRCAQAMLLALLAVAVLAVSACMASAWAQAQIPPAAHQHRLALKREAQRVWGLSAPVATFAAQIHQESRWRPDARSPVGAVGLAQFMPATALWMGDVDAALASSSRASAVQAASNPTWAIRAMVQYNYWLHTRIQADSPCEHMAFTLSAYNGGLGWLYKRQKLSPQPGLCLGHTCAINPGITPANQRENEHYPQVILRRLEPMYESAHWGLGVCP
jgi:soluble lytic murein transglycosylase-like protein